MSIEKLIAENTAALLALTAALQKALPAFADDENDSVADRAAAAVAVTEKPKAEKPKAEKPKAEPKPEAKPEPVSEPPANEDVPDDQEIAEQVDYETLRIRVLDLVKTHRTQVQALLNRYGCKTAKDLKPEQYGEFYANLSEISKG